MATTLVIRETATLTQDVNALAAVVNSRFILATALLQAGTPMQRSKVIELQIEYECDLTQTVLVEYSLDKGATWIAYSTIVFPVSFGPQIISCRRTATHHNIQMRLRATALGKLRILSFIPHIVAEGKVSP